MDLGYKTASRNTSSSRPTSIIKNPISALKQFGRRLFLSASLVFAACSPTMPSNMTPQQMADAGNASNDLKTNPSPTDMANMQQEDSATKLTEPEPCKTPDVKYAFDWKKLTAMPPGESFPFDASFGGKIQGVWIVDVNNKPDQEFFNSGVFNDLWYARKMIQFGFVYRPMNQDGNLYARAVYCAGHKQKTSQSTGMLGAIINKLKNMPSIDSYGIDMIASSFNDFSSVDFGGCFESNQMTDQAIAVYKQRAETAGVPSQMNTPVFVLFNPDNNRCTALMGPSSMNDFMARLDYLTK